MSEAGPDKADLPPKGGNPWSRLSARSRALVSAAATVLVLAAVILGVSALSNPKESGNETSQLTAAQESQLAYQAGMTELAAGETTAAVRSFERALALDSNNTAASTALADIENSSTDGGSDASGDRGDQGSTDSDADPKPEPDDAAFNERVDDLVVLLPKRAEGFALGSPVGVDTDAAVSGTPTFPEIVASRALWTVHDRKTAKGAAEFVESVSKTLYDQDADTLTVDGVEAYFGHDGERFATVAFVRGRYVFEVVLTTLADSPEALRSEAEQAAGAFPDSLED